MKAANWFVVKLRAGGREAGLQRTNLQGTGNRGRIGESEGINMRMIEGGVRQTAAYVEADKEVCNRGDGSESSNEKQANVLK